MGILENYGYTGNKTPPNGLIIGRVTELQRDIYTIMTELGEVSAVLKGSFYHEAEERADFPCVGDFVYLQYNDMGVSRITDLLPRHSKFSRADLSGHVAKYAKTVLEQVVATNFDYVFILSSLNWDFKVSRIMRYLTLTFQSGAKPVVVLTKADLVDSYDEQLHEIRIGAPGVDVYALSAHTGYGVNQLEEYLQPGKTIVFLGMSGVGKSSLVNALMREDVMTVKAIREDDSRGRHTTTHRQLFMLPGGAMVIDTPGMRELGLFDANEGISAGFAHIEALFSQCRFSNCSHKSEPGCAVLAALSDGSLTKEQWESYLTQKKENKFAQDKAGFLNEKRSRNKSISKAGKKRKTIKDI